MGDVNISEQLATRIRNILGEFNDDNHPVTGLVLNLVHRVTTLQAEKENWKRQATVMAKAADNEKGHVKELQAAMETLEGELGRLRKSLDQISGLWTCPDCGAKAKNGRICSECGLNHPEQSTKHPTQEPTNGS